MCYFNATQETIVNDCIFPQGFVVGILQGRINNTHLRSFVKSIGQLIWCIQKRSH
jgi:hypothetical protein